MGSDWKPHRQGSYWCLRKYVANNNLPITNIYVVAGDGLGSPHNPPSRADSSILFLCRYIRLSLIVGIAEKVQILGWPVAD